MTVDGDDRIESASAGDFWLLLSSVGLQVAGSADVPGIPVRVDQLPTLRELSRSGPSRSSDGDDNQPLRALSVTAAGSLETAPPAATGIGPEGASDAELIAPLLMRVANGEILAWSRRERRLTALTDQHVDLLQRLAAAAAPVSRHDLDDSTASTLADLVAHGWVHTPEPTVATTTPVVIATSPPHRPDPGQPDRGAEQSSVDGDVDETIGDASRSTATRPARSPKRWARRFTRRPQVASRRSRARSGEAPGGSSPGRVPVWPVTCADTEVGNALGLGMLIAAATSHDGGRLCDLYDFRPIRISADEAFEDITSSDEPGVLLLSTYIWSIGANLELAAKVKARSPRTIVIVGGPSAPKYEGDAKHFLDRYRQVDVIVRGEGEMTVSELLATLNGDLDRLPALVEVDGLTVRTGDSIVRTPDRERLADLNSVPSPYLAGLFDHLPAEQGIWAVETNRGCPYGCTFCDWGSATKSRIRKFDMDRVTAELDWLSRHGVQAIFVADANFGIFERDLDITRHVAALHAQRGAPTSFIASFAKNTTKYTVPIIRTLIDAGLSGDVAIAFQTTDDETLDNISRSNIKLDTYDQLARDVRADGLPILADIMIALPGSTIETLKNDLQHCVDSDVTARVFGTMVLPNSPMNDPEYRALHQIRTDSYDQVVATTSFGPEDREAMVRFRDVFRWADHFGLLRHIMRWEAHRSDLRELDVLWQINQVALRRDDAYPLLAFMVRSGRRYMVEPMAWRAFYEEVGRFLVEELGAPEDSELRTVLAVQEALMPAAGRAFPESVTLEHDYVAFYGEVLRPVDGVRLDRHLRDYPPAVLTVHDPHGISPGCLREMFQIEHSPEGARSLRHEGEFWQAFNWELESPLRRALRDQYYDAARSLPVLEKGTAPLVNVDETADTAGFGDRLPSAG